MPAVLEGHTDWVRALACTPDGATLASGGADRTVRLWRLADNTCTAVLEGHTSYVVALACTPDGAILASGGNDNTIRLWRLADNTCTAVLEGHTQSIYALVFSPDGTFLASCGKGGTHLWDPDNFKCIAIYKQHVWSCGLVWINNTKLAFNNRSDVIYSDIIQNQDRAPLWIPERECIICYEPKKEFEITCGQDSHAVCNECYAQMDKTACPLCRAPLQAATKWQWLE